MQIIDNPPRKLWEEIGSRPLIDNKELENDVRSIIEKVRLGGDTVLKEFTTKFDKVTIDDLKVSDSEIAMAGSRIDERLKDSIAVAATNIESFHKAQLPKDIIVETMPGIVCSQKVRPIERVGLYIPGGTAPLFSTVLMLAIPARIANCKEVILCTPPDKSGKIDPAILYAANFAGVKSIYSVGGAQAIAAMAFGTETIPKVDKIFGPGNQWVTMAKQLVSSAGIAIDLPAGPSEVAVIADKNVSPRFIAADLLSQAEHGNDSQVLLATVDKNIVEQVLTEIERLVNRLPRKDITKGALESCLIITFNDYDTLMEFINFYAPEHLIIATENYNELADMVLNAGSVFLGNFTPESAGDYASGTNHTLPTNGFAKAWSGVGTESFMKRITFQEITAAGLKTIGPVIEFMAQAEHLEGHRQAVKVRTDFITLSDNKSWDQSIH